MPRRDIDEQVLEILRTKKDDGPRTTSVIEDDVRPVVHEGIEQKTRSLLVISPSNTQPLQSWPPLRGEVEDRIRSVLQTADRNDDPWAALDLNPKDLTIDRTKICARVRHLLCTHYQTPNMVQHGLPPMMSIWMATVALIPEIFTTKFNKYNAGIEHFRVMFLGRSVPLYNSQADVGTTAVLAPPAEWPITESWITWCLGTFILLFLSIYI